RIIVRNRRPSVAQSGTLLYRQAIGGKLASRKGHPSSTRHSTSARKEPHRLHSRGQEKFSATFGHFFLCKGNRDPVHAIQTIGWLARSRYRSMTGRTRKQMKTNHNLSMFETRRNGCVTNTTVTF